MYGNIVLIVMLCEKLGLWSSVGLCLLNLLNYSATNSY